MRRRVFVPSMQGHDERSGEDSPAWNRSGLIAFECPRCVYVTSLLNTPDAHLL